MEEIRIRTSRRQVLHDITSDVIEVVKKSGVARGMCFIYVPHTTAGVTINENYDPSVKADMLQHLGRIVPADGHYAHLEGNSDAHIKSSLLGHCASVIVEEGRPVLGTWQGIFFAEFDGPRSRRFLVQIIEA